MRKCVEWKHLFLRSYSMLSLNEQCVITKEIYNNPIIHDEDGNEQDIDDRILLFFNSLLNDSNQNVSALREFAIISLLSPSKTIHSLTTNIVSHPNYAQLIATLLAKYPFLLYYKNKCDENKTYILWSQLTKHCYQKIKNGKMEINEARAMSIFITTLIVDHDDHKTLDILHPFKLCIIPLLNLCHNEYNKLFVDDDKKEQFMEQQRRKTNLKIFINDIIVPILNNMFRKMIEINQEQKFKQLITSYSTLSQKYGDDDLNDMHSSKLMDLFIECLVMLLSINNTRKLKECPKEIINAVQICMEFNIKFIHKLSVLLQCNNASKIISKKSLYDILRNNDHDNNKWINIWRLRALFNCKCLVINKVLIDIEHTTFWNELMILYDKYKEIDSQSINHKVFDQIYCKFNNYNIDLLEIGCVDDESCDLMTCSMINTYNITPSDTKKMYEFMNHHLIYKLIKIFPFLCENEINRLIEKLVLKICAYCYDKREIGANSNKFIGDSPFNKIISVYFGHKMSCILIIFRCLKQLIFDMDSLRYGQCLNGCLKTINYICSDYKMQRTQIYEIIALQYAVYRNSAELLSKMNMFKFNTNYIFIFLCDNLKNILDEMTKKLKNILLIKKKKEKKQKIKQKSKAKQQVYDIEEIIKEICILIHFELKQLPPRFNTLLTQIVDDYTLSNANL